MNTERRPDDRETALLREIIEGVVRDFPNRRAGSASERLAQQRVAAWLERSGADLTWSDFEWSRSLYGVMAAHFGIGALGAIVGRRRPLIGALLHGFAATSYYLDSTRQAYWLRDRLPTVTSQNLVATWPARTGRPRLRVVLVAHIDAAFTGTIFHPAVLATIHDPARTGEHQPYAARSMELATDAEFALAFAALARAFRGNRVPAAWRAAETLASIPAWLVCLLNLEVVIRDETVPGAADNLSGVAACVLLAQRIAARRRDDVEYVIAITGAEESGTGGAYRLAEERATEWSTADTVVIGVDTITNGDFRWFVDGEQGPVTPPAWAGPVAAQVAAIDPRFAALQRFEVPVGATDAMPFIARGYPAVTLGCVDPAVGAPRHYHRMSDTPENLDWDQLRVGVDLVDTYLATLTTTLLDA